MKQIINQVTQGLKGVAVETGKELVKEVGKAVTGAITGKELLKDIQPMGQGEYITKKEEDETKKREEIKEIGRNVEKEMDEVRKAKKNKEEEEEKKILEDVERQRQVEKQEQQAVVEPKGKRAQGSLIMPGKPKQSDRSQTAEFSKSVD